MVSPCFLEVGRASCFFKQAKREKATSTNKQNQTMIKITLFIGQAKVKERRLGIINFFPPWFLTNVLATEGRYQQ